MRRRPEHPVVQALVESFAREVGIDPQELWAYFDKRKAPPEDVRRRFVDTFYPLVSPEDFLHEGLTPHPNAAKVRSVSQAPSFDIRRIRRVGRPLNMDHPFTRALYEDNITVTEWAEAHKVSRVQVKGWFATGDGGRSIPREMAEVIEREFVDAKGKTRVPANAKTWRNGIRG